MDALCSSQARVLDERRLRVNACICDTVSKAEPILNTNSSNVVRLYRKFIEKRTDIENRTKVKYLQAILHAIVADNFPEHQDFGSKPDSLSMQRLLLATVYFLDGLLSNTPIFETLRSVIEKLGIGFENHVTSFLQTAFPDEEIYDCWKSEKAVVCSIIGQAHLLRPYLTRSLKERHHLFYTNSGYIGSSLDGIQAGDVISVVQGCPCPVLLRKVGTRYIHLGTCYVLGLMNGEAALRVKQGFLTIAEVDIA